MSVLCQIKMKQKSTWMKKQYLDTYICITMNVFPFEFVLYCLMLLSFYIVISYIFSAFMMWPISIRFVFFSIYLILFLLLAILKYWTMPNMYESKKADHNISMEFGDCWKILSKIIFPLCKMIILNVFYFFFILLITFYANESV